MPQVAVIGPGAVGATFAAAAERAGHAVVLCGRSAGVPPVVELPGGAEHALSGPLLTDPEAAASSLWVLLAVKTHQVAGAAPWLRRLCGAGTVVVALQNGVEHRELVQPLAPEARVLPAVVWVPAEAVEPGRVRRRGEVHLIVPEGDDGRSLAALLGDHARVDVSPDFATAAWMKLATNAVAGLMVLSGRRARMFRRQDVAALARAYAEEVLEVARAEGVSPGTADDVMAGYASMPEDLGSSILFDRLAGRPLEWDARNGVVQRLGARHGIATPISNVVVPLLAAASDG
jgi:2-dehydropantoate 2-reductase